jgi:hypothetical protein
MKHSAKSRETLILFNLETNLESKVLAAAHDWIEAFSQHFSKVIVYSTHVGSYALPANVKVSELGGGTPIARIKNLLSLCVLLLKLIRNRKSVAVFHHMSSKTLAILGLPLKILRIPQGIWYSHSHVDLALKLGKVFAEHIFTSIEGAIPLSGKKLRYVGHGIKVPLEGEIYSGAEHRSGLVALGRIARIKKLEIILENLAANNILNLPVCFIGPIEDYEYMKELSDIAEEHHINLAFRGPISHAEIYPSLKNFEFLYTGTPGSVDKATLEGSLAGCFIITTNHDAMQLSGMDAIWKELNIAPSSDLSSQIQQILKLEPSFRSDLRSGLVRRCAQNNDINKTVGKISEIIQGESSEKKR